MSDLYVSGMAIAPSVVETIVTMAARDVEGVASVGSDAPSGLRSLLPGGKPASQGVAVDVDENDKLHISVRIDVKSGHTLPDVAADVRRAIADSIAMQVGVEVGSVDVFIDGIHFSK
jgi:uncharacterized alkaline shock family protein YloU